MKLREFFVSTLINYTDAKLYRCKIIITTFLCLIKSHGGSLDDTGDEHGHDARKFCASSMVDPICFLNLLIWLTMVRRREDECKGHFQTPSNVASLQGCNKRKFQF